MGSLTDVAASLYGTGGAREREAEQMKIRANAMRPEYAKITQAADDQAKIAAQRPTLPVLGEPPSRGLRDFLATSENESPLTSVSKLVQALSLFAGATVGTTRHNAMGAMAAFAGALKGWQAGDAERADRSFKDWEAQTGKALKQYDLERTAYNDALTAGGLTLDARMKQAQIKALEYGDTQAVLAFERGGLEGALTFLTGREDAASKLQVQRDQMIASVMKAAEDRQLRVDLANQSDATRRELASQADATRRDLASERAQDRKDKAAEGKVLPAGQVESLSDMRAFIRQLGDVGNAFDPKYTGPVVDWLKWAKSKSVGLEKQEEQFRSMLSNFENTLLKLRSGAAVTQQEYDRLKRELPTTADPPGKFLAKLETVRTLMQQSLTARESGYKTAGYRMPDVGAAASETMKLPDGTVVEIRR